jgi:hypothetical protein
MVADINTNLARKAARCVNHRAAFRFLPLVGKLRADGCVIAVAAMSTWRGLPGLKTVLHLVCVARGFNHCTTYVILAG